MKFTKMHGIGNCYIYINCFEEHVDNPCELSEKLSDVHFGIGADGLVLICPSDTADFKMRIFNADGSEAKMCGNASRCVGKYVYEKGLTDKTEITLETLSGIKVLNLEVESGIVQSVTVDMGKVSLYPKDIPVLSEKKSFINEPVEVGGKIVNITAVSVGNPHAVVFTDNVSELDLNNIGPKFENHKLFPDRVNTEFVRVINENTLEMRVWERGSGETWACGTGACASVAAAVENGYCKKDEEITVHLRGGNLKIVYRSDGYIIKKGPAAFICDGETAQ